MEPLGEIRSFRIMEAPVDAYRVVHHHHWIHWDHCLRVPESVIGQIVETERRKGSEDSGVSVSLGSSMSRREA